MSDEIESLLKNIGAVADESDVQIYAVGGFVRDQLLNRDTNEVDFVVLGDGPEIAALARQRIRGHGFVVYQKFGTASFLVNDYKFEFVSARKETYKKDSRNPDVERADLSEDLERRDFTVNAMAMKVNGDGFGEIIDLFNGRQDLEDKLLRTPLEPEATFSDDPLRIMRAARFAGQLGFELHPDVKAAMEKSRKRLKIVSQERITDELFKILSHKKPSIGLRFLQEPQVLDIIFPELAEMVGVDQRDQYHHKDVFAHTLKVLDNLAELSDDPMLRWTALVHDIGKPKVKQFVEGAGWTFHGHELVGVRLLKRICPRLKLSKEMSKFSQKLTRLHMRPIQLIGEEVTDSAIRRLLVQAGDEIDDLMTLCRADITSGNPKRVEQHLANFDYVTRRMKEVEEKDKMRAFQSPVRGDEIMRICGLEPGPMVGRLKKQIEEAILDGDIPNERDAALAYLLKIKDAILKGES
jgi:putative nucleotidyltransferase with HDIG domain